jgi:hypothetical protein
MYGTEDLVFCSKLLYPVGGQYYLGPKIGRIICKVGFMLRDLEPDLALIMFRGSIKSLLTSVSYVPVLKELFARLTQLVGEGETIMPDGEYSLYAGELHDYDINTEYFVCERYGITIEELRNLIKYVSNVELTTDMVSPTLDVIIEKDIDFDW